MKDVVYEHTHKVMPNIIEDTFNILEWYSYLQYYNTTKILSTDADGIRFKGFKISSLIDGKNSVCCKDCLDIVRKHGNNSHLPHFPTEEILQSFREQNKTTDFYNLHRGHDVVHCMAIIIRDNTCSSGKKICGEQLANELRVHYQFSDFRETNLFHELDDWMTTNGHHLWN